MVKFQIHALHKIVFFNPNCIAVGMSVVPCTLLALVGYKGAKKMVMFQKYKGTKQI